MGTDTTNRFFIAMSSPFPRPSDGSSLSELQALLFESDTLHHFLGRLAHAHGASVCPGSARAVSRSVRTPGRSPWPPVMGGHSESTSCNMTWMRDRAWRPWRPEDHSTLWSTATETRWPRFCSGAHEQGVRSCLGLPLNGPTGLMGGYNLYSMWPDGFAPDTRGQLEVFAGNAAGAVAVAMKLADQSQMSEDLHEALTSRAVIDQATGIIMAQQRCGAAAAFDIIRRASQNRDLSEVHNLTAEIVSQVSGKPPRAGHLSSPPLLIQILACHLPAMPGLQARHRANASATVLDREE